MAGWNHVGVFVEKQCVVCGNIFKPQSGIHKFCSATCKGKWKYITGIASTENQYKVISGNWDRYLKRLLYCDGRKRDGLTFEILYNQLKKQNYRCALSGEPLTCFLEKGIKCGPYTEDNIQLVCRSLNSWRSDLSNGVGK